MADGQPQIWLDRRTYTVGFSDRSARLTPSGFAVLQLLHQRRGEVVPFDELARGAEIQTTLIAESALHTAIYRVRSALTDLGAPGLITSVRRIGYQLAPDAAAQLSPQDLEAALRATASPLLLARDDRVILANRTAGDLFHKAAGELEGGPIPDSPSPINRTEFRDGLHLLEYHQP